jgi:hypothetical protein
VRIASGNQAGTVYRDRAWHDRADAALHRDKRALVAGILKTRYLRVWPREI